MCRLGVRSEGVKGLKDGQCTVGVSQDGTKDSVYEPYIVVLEKRKGGIRVKEFRNMKVDKQLPLDMMITIFRLQIQLDRIKGDTVSPEQAVNALNAVIPGNRFRTVGDRWINARNNFRNLLRQGKVYIHSDPELVDGLKKIRYDTPWEDYPKKVRALIGSFAFPTDKKGETVTITTPKDWRFEKYKVFDFATEFMLGKTSEYLRPSGKE